MASNRKDITKLSNHVIEEDLIQAKKNPFRIYSIDTIRGYSILLMIAWHYYFMLKVNYFETKMYILFLMNLFGQVANPIFIIIMGIALSLSMDKRDQSGKNFNDNLIHLIKRAIIFFLLNQVLVIAYIFYFGFDLTFSMEGLYPGWIPSLGISSVVCFFLKYLRKIYRILIIIVIEFFFELHLIEGYWIFNLSAVFFMTIGTIVGEYIIDARNKNAWKSFQRK
ncbi:MAG: heparan-alpha-glucosaminide N-acetyltransferase domain-containing protein, partial [Candidatus Helarchaeota archaeon]